MQDVHRKLMQIVPLMLFVAMISSACVAADVAWVPTATKSYVDSHPDAAQAVAAKKTQEIGNDVPIAVVVNLKLRNQDKLDSAIAGGALPMTSEQFNQAHAPTDADTAAVVAYLKDSGFTNVIVAPNHLLISADGSAASIKRAFNTSMLSYVKDGRKVVVNAADAMVPPKLATIILSVGGLQNADRAHTMTRPISSAPATAN